MKTLQKELDIELESQETKTNPKQSLYSKMNDNIKEMKHVIEFENLLCVPSSSKEAEKCHYETPLLQTSYAG